MEKLFGKPDIVAITGRCEQCGAEYDAKVRAMLRASFGAIGPSLCLDCRGRLVKELDEDRARRHQARLAFQRQEWLSDSQRGLPLKFRESSFDTFDPSAGSNRDRVMELREYAERFPKAAAPRGMESVVLARDKNGVGKTHLASSIFRAVVEASEIDNERSPYQFWPVNRVRTRLAAAKRFGGPETEDEVIADLGSMWLLVLDDVGKEILAGDHELYFAIINERYNRQLPVVITSNVGFEPWDTGEPALDEVMGRAVASRLREMCQGVQYIIEGEERR